MLGAKNMLFWGRFRTTSDFDRDEYLRNCSRYRQGKTVLSTTIPPTFEALAKKFKRLIFTHLQINTVRAVTVNALRSDRPRNVATSGISTP